MQSSNQSWILQSREATTFEDLESAFFSLFWDSTQQRSKHDKFKAVMWHQLKAEEIRQQAIQWYNILAAFTYRQFQDQEIQEKLRNKMPSVLAF